ncbi:MAG: class I SAM-dependent rRNA methyltransferase [Gemmatimonadetes bacterium]|nr:class I SAM-dependent rRNA methyltransferase [Gemmatimonadota bacterium]
MFPAEPPRVYLKSERARPFFGRHPWVFSGAIRRLDGDPADGDEVAVLTEAGDFIAWGLFNSKSQIRVRLYSWDAERRLADEFWRQAIAAAVHLRHEVLGLGDPAGACRLVFSEGDGISGLIADRYADFLAVQFTSLALAQRRDVIMDELVRLCQPRGVYLRTERGMREAEGLDVADSPAWGDVPDGPVTIIEDDLQFHVDVRTGQKTGFYLDQRENRRAARRFARGRRILDVCCYTGAFSLALARAGAAEALAIDVSAAALDIARRNAELNGITNVRFETGNAFERLEQLADRGERFDLVVLDPPRFARTRRGLEQALRGYGSLNELAVRVLAPGGILVTCSCSGRVTPDDFTLVLAGVAERTGRALRFLERRGQASDHPVSAHCLETAYLKCFICHVT